MASVPRPSFPSAAPPKASPFPTAFPAIRGRRLSSSSPRRPSWATPSFSPSATPTSSTISSPPSSSCFSASPPISSGANAPAPESVASSPHFLVVVGFRLFRLSSLSPDKPNNQKPTTTKKWGEDATDSGAGAFAPEEIGGEAEKHDDDGGDEIVELVGVAEGEKDGVAHDGRRGEDEDKRRPRIAGNAVGNGLALGGAADGKDGRGTEAIENPADKNHAAD